jgi:thymidylate synthase ThyX
MHFYDLRNSKRALKEIRTLANKMVEILPEDYKMFFYSYFI